MDKLPDDIIEKINKMKIESELMDEYWIDLHILVPCSSTENGLKVFHYEYNEKMPEPYINIKYHLRLALRKLGKKIIKHKKIINYEDLTTFCETFYTNITEKEYDETTQLYNSYDNDIYEEYINREEDEEEHEEDEEGE